MDIQQFLKYKIPIFLLSVFFYSLFFIIHEISTRDKSCNILQSNPIQQNYKLLYGTKLKQIFVIFSILLLYSSIIYGISKSPFWNDSTQLYFFIYGFLILFLANWMFITGIHKSIKNIGNSTIMNIFSSLIYISFYCILIFYFIMNLANDGPLLGVENIFIFTMITVIGIMSYREGMRIKEVLMTDLKKNNYNFMTIQCFPTGDFHEDYQNPENENPSLLQYRNLITEKGTDYIKLQENIPIQFKNPITQQYQDFILADFYFPGSYYTYIEDTPIYGHPSLEAIQLAFEDYKIRIVHLDIFASKTDKNQPCVRCEKMAKDAKELSLESCFRVIEKYGWNEKQKYPIFLYLRFMEQNNEEFYGSIEYFLNIDEDFFACIKIFKTGATKIVSNLKGRPMNVFIELLNNNAFDDLFKTMSSTNEKVIINVKKIMNKCIIIVTNLANLFYITDFINENEHD